MSISNTDTILNNDDQNPQYINKKICNNCAQDVECHNIDCLKTYCKKCYAYCEFKLLLNCNNELDTQCPFCVGSYCTSTDYDEHIIVCGNCLRCSNWCKTCDIIFDFEDKLLIKKHKLHKVFKLFCDKSFDMFIKSHNLCCEIIRS